MFCINSNEPYKLIQKKQKTVCQILNGQKSHNHILLTHNNANVYILLNFHYFFSFPASSFSSWTFKINNKSVDIKEK